MRVLCLTIALILGLYFLRNNIALSIIISLIYLLFIFVRFNKKFASVILLVFIGGALIGNLQLEYNNSENSYQGMVVEVKENYFLFQSHYEKFYVYEENTEREIGDFLTIKSKVSEFKSTTYESQFDSAAYLKDKGVKRSLNSKEYHVDFANPIRIHSLKEKFLNKFDNSAKVLINAILFNEKDYSDGTLDPFINLNLIYLVSLTGIYINILFVITTYIFGLFTSKKFSQAIPIALFSPLLFLSFPRVSILRIFLIKTLKYLNDHFLNKRFSYLTLLSSLALFFVIIDFHLAYQQAYYVGFLISLLGVFARTSLKINSFKNQKLFYMICVYLFIIPFSIQISSTFHILAPIFQIMMVPVFVVLVILSLIALINIPVVGILNPYANFLVGISKSLLRFDVSLPFMVNDWFIFIYYALIIAIIYLLESQRLAHFRNVSLALCSFIVISLMPINVFSKGVYFINVGQGDSILIRDHNKTVMIDTGGNIKFDMATETLIPFFNKIGVRHLDLLVTTHDDFDHSGAVPSLIENFKVYSYLKDKESFPYQVGNITLNNINFYEGDENDSSLVFLLDFMNKKWLFTGDASIESEKSILKSGIDIDCDILKVGHHGSKTSSCEEFIKAASPSEAIISCGAKNYYGHPNKEVLDILDKYNVKIRRTDVEGTISYVSIFA